MPSGCYKQKKIWSTKDRMMEIELNGGSFSFGFFGPEDPNSDYNWSYRRGFSREEMKELASNLIQALKETEEIE